MDSNQRVVPPAKTSWFEITASLIYSFLLSIFIAFAAILLLSAALPNISGTISAIIFVLLFIISFIGIFMARFKKKGVAKVISLIAFIITALLFIGFKSYQGYVCEKAGGDWQMSPYKYNGYVKNSGIYNIFTLGCYRDEGNIIPIPKDDPFFPTVEIYQEEYPL